MNGHLQQRSDLLIRALHGVGLMGLGTIVATILTTVYHPLEAQRQIHLRESRRLQGQLEHAEATFAYRDQLERELDELTGKIASLRRRIPAQEGEAEFLEFVTRTAHSCGAELVDFRRQGVTSQPQFSQLQTVVQCRGSFAALCRFVRQVTQAERLVTVDHLDLTADFQDGRHTLQMDLILYYGLRDSQAETPSERSL